MNIEIIKKERNTHDRIRKRVVLVVTIDTSITVDTLADSLAINRSDVSIRILHTSLKGDALKRAVDRYMSEISMKSIYGDKVIYWDEESIRGGEAFECAKTD